MPEKINILGAGLVGSLLSTLLSERGFDVHVYERRNDPRRLKYVNGRSINLALSHRGIKSLQLAGIYEGILPLLVPMKGRMIHDVRGDLHFQAYGKDDQHINSVSRTTLNDAIINHAEANGTTFHFGQLCESVNPENTSIKLAGNETEVFSDVIIGADGARSKVRKSIEQLGKCESSQTTLEHGYKELTIPAIDNDFAIEPNSLHIWPRGNFMLIALPNPDKTFTCTLFLSLDGKDSFAQLKSESDILYFFEKYFPDALRLFPDLTFQFQKNPVSLLETVKISSWSYKKTTLIGDAGHTIVPFYGQGMNAGFEDCRLLMEWGEELKFDWEKLLPLYSENRKPDTDAISDLAMKNFVEMRDHVSDDHFLKIKQLERRLQENYPDIWTPLYSMITFSDIPYLRALQLGKIQEKIMKGLPIGFDPKEEPLQPLIDAFSARVLNVH